MGPLKSDQFSSPTNSFWTEVCWLHWWLVPRFELLRWTTAPPVSFWSHRLETLIWVDRSLWLIAGHGIRRRFCAFTPNNGNAAINPLSAASEQRPTASEPKRQVQPGKPCSLTRPFLFFFFFFGERVNTSQGAVSEWSLSTYVLKAEKKRKVSTERSCHVQLFLCHISTSSKVSVPHEEIDAQQ